MWDYKNLVTNIPPAQILLLLTHQRGKGKHQLRLQEVFSSLPWFGHCQMIMSPLLWGHSSAEAAEGTWGGGAKDLDRNHLINAVAMHARDKLGSFRGFPADALLLFAKTEPFLHNTKLSQQRWPGQHLIFLLPASISEKGWARACQSLELDTN